MSKKEIVEFSVEILKGLSYLHGNNAVHRDLKPANILLFRNNSLLKIADLGEAKFIDPANKNTLKGTPNYMAPEIFSGRLFSFS